MAGLISCYPFKAKLYYMCVNVNDELKCKHSKCLLSLAVGYHKGILAVYSFIFHYHINLLKDYFEFTSVTFAVNSDRFHCHLFKLHLEFTKGGTVHVHVDFIRTYSFKGEMYTLLPKWRREGTTYHSEHLSMHSCSTCLRGVRVVHCVK